MADSVRHSAILPEVITEARENRFGWNNTRVNGSSEEANSSDDFFGASQRKGKEEYYEKNREHANTKSANSNFGPWGWFIILFALLSFMFAGNLIVDGLNITVAAFTELRGWESGVLLSCSTVAGLVAIVGCVILSNCVCRFGVKAVYCVSLAVVCCCCMVWGSVTQLWQYILILILVNVFGNGFGFVGGTAILANWFPQKKGLAMGWATIGFQASAVALLPAFQWLLERYNLKVAYRLMGLCLLALLWSACS